MGMFDYVKCEYPLPDVPNYAEIPFQSKDTDAQYLEQYRVTQEGRLLHERVRYEDHSDPNAEGLARLAGMMTPVPEGWEDTNFHGMIEIGWSNIVAAGPGIYTAHGEDAWYLDFRLTFDHGTLVKVETLDNHKEAAAPREMFPIPFPRLTEAEKAAIAARQNEPLTGNRILLWWGGDISEPYWATVIAEDDRELVCKLDKGGFENVPRFQRDNCFFDSLEDGQAHRDNRKSRWETEKRKYDEYIAGKQPTTQPSPKGQRDPA